MGLDYPYTSLILNGICQENRDRIHFRLEMLALPPLHLQSQDDDRLEDLLSHSPIEGIITLPRLSRTTLQRAVERGGSVVQLGFDKPRSEERRVGEEVVRKCISRWSPDH